MSDKFRFKCTDDSKESQNGCHSNKSPENEGKVSLGSLWNWKELVDALLAVGCRLWFCDLSIRLGISIRGGGCESWVRRVSDFCTGGCVVTSTPDDMELLETLWLRTYVFTFNIERLELSSFSIWWFLRSKLNMYSSVSAISVSISSSGRSSSIFSFKSVSVEIFFSSAAATLANSSVEPSSVFLEIVERSRYSTLVSVADVFHFWTHILIILSRHKNVGEKMKTATFPGSGVFLSTSFLELPLRDYNTSNARKRKRRNPRRRPVNVKSALRISVAFSS